jgi:hypothetical protein
MEHHTMHLHLIHNFFNNGPMKHIAINIKNYYACCNMMLTNTKKNLLVKIWHLLNKNVESSMANCTRKF